MYPIFLSYLWTCFSPHGFLLVRWPLCYIRMVNLKVAGWHSRLATSLLSGNLFEMQNLRATTILVLSGDMVIGLTPEKNYCFLYFVVLVWPPVGLSKEDMLDSCQEGVFSHFCWFHTRTPPTEKTLGQSGQPFWSICLIPRPQGSMIV